MLQQIIDEFSFVNKDLSYKFIKKTQERYAPTLSFSEVAKDVPFIEKIPRELYTHVQERMQKFLESRGFANIKTELILNLTTHTHAFTPQRPFLGVKIAAFDNKLGHLLSYRLSPFSGEKGLELEAGVVATNKKSKNPYNGFGIHITKNIINTSEKYLDDFICWNFSPSTLYSFAMTQLYGLAIDHTRVNANKDKEVLKEVNSILTDFNISIADKIIYSSPQELRKASAYLTHFEIYKEFKNISSNVRYIKSVL